MGMRNTSVGLVLLIALLTAGDRHLVAATEQPSSGKADDAPPRRKPSRAPAPSAEQPSIRPDLPDRYFSGDPYPPNDFSHEALRITAERAFEATYIAHDEGLVDLEKVYLASRRLRDAESALAKNHAERVSAYADHAERMEELWRKTHTLSEARERGGEAHNEATARFHMINAKLWLTSVQQQQPCGSCR